MQSTDQPLKFPVAFGVSAAPALITTVPVASQIGVTDGAASMTTGFVPKNFQSRVSGGVPPRGKDFNGLMNQITQGLRSQQAGQMPQFDSVHATNIGGYPKGAVLQSADRTKIYISTSENNTTNPDTDLTYWLTLVGGTGSAINSAIIQLYQVTATATPPSVPSTTATYTFSSGNLTGINNGWTTSLPTSGGSYRWLTTTQVVGTGATATIATGNWATPAILAADGAPGAVGTPGATGATGATGPTGANGLNNAIVLLYQRASSAPAVPSSTTTYNFSTAVATGMNNGWTQAIPAGSLPLYATTASASSSATTTTIAGSSWAAPVVVTQNGVDGANGLNSATVFLYQQTSTNVAPSEPSTTTTYTFATGVATGFNNGWQQSLPTGGGPYNWIITASALGTGATDTIGAGEWSAVALLSTNGAPGATGPTGATGATGAAGTNGINNAVVFLYQRASTAPSVPSTATTYTFATGVATGFNNGWTQSIPTGTLPLYATTAAATGTGTTATITTGQWATPVVFVQNGADGAVGTNTATVFLYQRTTTSTPPAVPSATVTYTFATSVASGVNNGWTQTLPTTGGAYRWLTTATALGTGSTDTIGTGEWASPALIAQDGAAGATGSTGATGSPGANGANGLNNAVVYIFQRAASAPALPSATTTYTFASGALTGLNNGWSSSVPGGSTLPVWVSTATASSTGSTDTIGSGEWASPVTLAANGINTAIVFLYQNTTTNSAPAVPSSTSTYTFATGNLSGYNNGWTTSVPSGGGSYRWVTTASALGTDPTDTIASSEWSTPSLLAQDGAQGPTGATGANGATGSPGSSAQLLYLTFNAITFTYDGTGAANPSSQTITATANLQNVSGTISWAVALYNAAGTSLGYTGTVVDNTHCTLNNTQFGSAAYAIFTASLGGLSDTQTIVRVASGAAGANGSNGAPGSPGANGSNAIAITGVLSNDTTQLPADANGNVTSYVGASSQLYIYNNAIDDSSNWTFSQSPGTGITSSMSGSVCTVTAMSSSVDTSYVDITASRSGFSSVTKRFTLTKAKSAVLASNINQSIGTISLSSSTTPSTVQDNAGMHLHSDGHIWTRRGNSSSAYAQTTTLFDTTGSCSATYYVQYDLLTSSVSAGSPTVSGTGQKYQVTSSVNSSNCAVSVTNGAGTFTFAATIYDSTGANKLGAFNVSLTVDSSN